MDVYQMALWLYSMLAGTGFGVILGDSWVQAVRKQRGVQHTLICIFQVIISIPCTFVLVCKLGTFT